MILIGLAASLAVRASSIFQVDFLPKTPHGRVIFQTSLKFNVLGRFSLLGYPTTSWFFCFPPKERILQLSPKGPVFLVPFLSSEVLKAYCFDMCSYSVFVLKVTP